MEEGGGGINAGSQDLFSFDIAGMIEQLSYHQLALFRFMHGACRALNSANQNECDSIRLIYDCVLAVRLCHSLLWLINGCSQNLWGSQCDDTQKRLKPIIMLPLT
jgi:hypothetical protein